MEDRNQHKAQAAIHRRSVLKSIAGFAAASALNPSLTGLAQPQPGVKSINPKWYGFNLLEYFSSDKDWMQHFPYNGDGQFREDDFRWMRDWGFNWARLPMDYRLWTDSADLLNIREKDIEPIDRVIKLGEKYGVHINICLCRAPGEWIQDDAVASVTGIRQEPEKTSVYTDAHTLDAFVHQWAYFAERYKGIPSKSLSFNLVNEPLERNVDHDTGLKNYARIARTSIEAIRGKDAQRLIVSDGYQVGREPVAELYDTKVVQSCHDYNPMEVTHPHAPWVRPLSDNFPIPPTWPLKDSKGQVIADKQTKRAAASPWAEPAKHGVPIHFGEMGCYNHTPPEVVYAWYNDTLDVVNELRSGWALWNFRGSFGILDSGRAGTKYTDWHGHKLDINLLNLLKSKMRG